MKKNKRKWKSLTLKVEHLRLELEDHEEVLSSATQEFMKQLNEVAEGPPPPPKPKAPPAENLEGGQSGHTSSEEPTQPEHEPQDKSELPEEIKALWKQIAKVAHPDKTGGDPEKTELYKRAATAAAEGAVDENIAVALELGLDVPEASEAVVEKLEKVADDLQGRLNNLENSVLWQWASAPPNKRAAIMALYMKSKGLKPKKKS